MVAPSAGLFRSLVALAALGLAGVALAVEDAPYVVDMKLWIEGELRGEPLVVVRPAELASVQVGGEQGAAGWRIEVLVEPQIAAEQGRAGSIWLNVSVLEQRDGEWNYLTDSLLGLPEGETGSMSMNQTGDQPEEPQDSRVYLEVEVARLRPEQSDG